MSRNKLMVISNPDSDSEWLKHIYDTYKNDVIVVGHPLRQSHDDFIEGVIQVPLTHMKSATYSQDKDAIQAIDRSVEAIEL